MDKKYQIQLIAEEIAEERHHCEFYELSDELQSKVWREAEVRFEESLMDRADMLRKDGGIILGR